MEWVGDCPSGWVFAHLVYMQKVALVGRVVIKKIGNCGIAISIG